MNTILLAYHPFNLENKGSQCRYAHCDINVARYLNKLQPEKPPGLHITTFNRPSLDKSFFEKFSHLHLNAIVSYPFCNEFENYAQEKRIPYFGLEHFAPGSTYLDRFWLFNSETITTCKVFSESRDEDCSELLSPLAVEASCYSRFMPLPNKKADLFYQKDLVKWLIIVGDTFGGETKDDLALKIAETVAKHTSQYQGDICLFLFGNNSKQLRIIRNAILSKVALRIELISDHYCFLENSVFSMIQKSDLILCTDRGIGLDAIILHKPVIFIRDESPLLKELNIFFKNPLNTVDQLRLLMLQQYKSMEQIVHFLETTNLTIPNYCYGAEDFHKHLSVVCPCMTDKNRTHSPNRPFNLPTITDPKDAIVPEHRHPSLVQKRAFSKYIENKMVIGKKYDKLRRDHRSFLLDSKHLALRYIGSLL